jgi:hypothetical protein
MRVRLTLDSLLIASNHSHLGAQMPVESPTIRRFVARFRRKFLFDGKYLSHNANPDCILTKVTGVIRFLG